MKKNLYSVFFALLLTALTACGGSASDSESISDISSEEKPTEDSSVSSTEPPMTDDELFASMKLSLYAMDQGLVTKTTEAVQTDGYGAIDMTVKVSSVTTKYQDHFIQTLATQTIEDTSLSYTQEQGMRNETSYYVVTAFNEDESENKAELFQLRPDYEDSDFGIGFASYFATVMVDGINNFKATYPNETVTHNFATVDLATDGEKYFYLCCLVGDEQDFDYKVEIESTIQIEQGLIVSAHTVALQSLVNDTNYSYITSDETYKTGDIQAYQGEKIDYEKYL